MCVRAQCSQFCSIEFCTVGTLLNVIDVAVMRVIYHTLTAVSLHNDEPPASMHIGT